MQSLKTENGIRRLRFTSRQQQLCVLAGLAVPPGVSALQEVKRDPEEENRILGFLFTLSPLGQYYS
jgi:hypothetical protein